MLDMVKNVGMKSQITNIELMLLSPIKYVNFNKIVCTRFIVTDSVLAAVFENQGEERITNVF